MYNCIEIIRDGRVATLALNMPEKLNAISAPVAQEVTAAIKELDADDSVGAIVLTGRGKHFCAGGDIKRMKQLVDTKVYITADGIQICDDEAVSTGQRAEEIQFHLYLGNDESTPVILRFPEGTKPSPGLKVITTPVNDSSNCSIGTTTTPRAGSFR